jgi:hypothetical protein
MVRGGYQYERRAADSEGRCYDADPMASLGTSIRTRIIPAILTALGVTFLAAGMLSFTTPAAAVPVATPSTSQAATVDQTPAPLFTLPPLTSAAPQTALPGPVDRVATRIRIAALKIDLPVIKPPSGFPACNVAMYYEDPRLGQPGQGKSVYIFAHARTGMFLPILTASKVSNGKKMIGMIAEVWTSDDQRFLYVITDVLRHVPYDEAFTKPFATQTETLWLQTSEGVGTQPKLQLRAELLSQEAAPHEDAHPKAKPVSCA